MQQLHKHIFCLLAITFFPARHVSAQFSCVTPYNTYGRCLPYNQCGFLNKLLDEYGTTLPQQFQDDIVKARCQGRRNSTIIHLCCDETISLSEIPKLDGFAYKLNATGLRVLREQNCGKTADVASTSSYRLPVARLFEFPWLALLRYDTVVNQFRCSGNLITQRYVLTAAHCLRTTLKLIGVRLGELNLATDEDCVNTADGKMCAPPVEDYGIQATIIHPEFRLRPPQLDLGLVKLDRIVEYKQHIMPICLPTTQQLAEKVSTSTEFSVVSWGLAVDSVFPNVLRKAVVPVVKQKDCEEAYAGYELASYYICAGGGAAFTTYRGDSGAPLYLSLTVDDVPQRNVLFAVLSKGLENYKFPDLYINIVDYMPWITNHIS